MCLSKLYGVCITSQFTVLYHGLDEYLSLNGCRVSIYP